MLNIQVQVTGDGLHGHRTGLYMYMAFKWHSAQTTSGK